MKKFELALETEKVFFGIKMFRVRALVSFSFVTKGDLGGYVEQEKNLDQTGNAWVYGDAQVYGDALVYGDAQVYGDALVYGDAQVYGNARVYGNAWVYGDALVYGDAQVGGNARVERTYQANSVSGLRWTMTSLPKSVAVGCENHTMLTWKEKHPEIGARNGLTPELSTAYYLLMKALRRVQRLEHKLSKQGG